jgi:hypothetical protein
MAVGAAGSKRHEGTAHVEETARLLGRENP